jgi:hypothetical protein
MRFRIYVGAGGRSPRSILEGRSRTVVSRQRLNPACVTSVDRRKPR